MQKITYQSEPIKKNKTTEYNQKDYLRNRRAKECFPIVNRGQLWYNMLTIEQFSELFNWYNAWLDVTETLSVPEMPSWINKKLEGEELL